MDEKQKQIALVIDATGWKKNTLVFLNPKYF